MVIEAHKALKKRRKLRKLSVDELQHYKTTHKALQLPPAGSDVNIFGFLSKKKEGYNGLIKQIGSKKDKEFHCDGNVNKTPIEFCRSKSCSDATPVHENTILNLERSPRHNRRYSFSDRVTVVFSKSKNYLLGNGGGSLLNPLQAEGNRDLNMSQSTVCENQLDKEANEEHRGVGIGDGTTDSHLWVSEYQPLLFPNANITYIDENLLNNDLEDEEAKATLSTSDENGEFECDSKETDTSIFTDGSDQSYIEIEEEYSKERNTDG